MSEILAEGKYLRLLKNSKGWEFAERISEGGAVVIVPLRDDNKVILIEQYRPPIGCTVIEFPAGLVGDSAEFQGELLEVAAERELLEETGYAAAQMEYLTDGPPSAGMSNERVTFFLASSLRRVAEGGGDENEDIDIHEIPLKEVSTFLENAKLRGAEIDPKVYAGLYFLGASTTHHKATLPISIQESPRRIDSPGGLPLADALLRKIDANLPPLPEGGRVGILGGTFNPPHVGHALLAHAMLATENIDELWIIPVYKHPFGKGMVDFDARVELCRRAFSKLGDKVRVVEIERDLPKPSYTVQTLSALHAVRPGITPTLIIGSDIVPELPRWNEPEKLPILSNIIVVPRQGAPLLTNPDTIDLKIYRGFRLPKVSSSAIKRAIRSGDSIDGLLDLEVLKYIQEHQLYPPE